MLRFFWRRVYKSPCPMSPAPRLVCNMSASPSSLTIDPSQKAESLLQTDSRIIESSDSSSLARWPVGHKTQVSIHAEGIQCMPLTKAMLNLAAIYRIHYKVACNKLHKEVRMPWHENVVKYISTSSHLTLSDLIAWNLVTWNLLMHAVDGCEIQGGLTKEGR